VKDEQYVINHPGRLGLRLATVCARAHHGHSRIGTRPGSAAGL